MTKERNHKHFGELKPIDLPKGKWRVITMAFVTLLPKTKNRDNAVLTVVCKLTKMIRLILRTIDVISPTIALFFKNIDISKSGNT